MRSNHTADYAHTKYKELDRHLTETQLADRWQKSPKTLQNARVSGTGVPYVKIGRSVRYRLMDVLEYEQRRIRSNTSAEDSF